MRVGDALNFMVVHALTSLPPSEAVTKKIYCSKTKMLSRCVSRVQADVTVVYICSRMYKGNRACMAQQYLMLVW